jgi:hypothetical protein
MQAPEYLNKVKSDKKALEVAAILGPPHPTHAQRLWLAGFLKFCGYSMIEVLDIIHEHAQWADYDERITAQQVASVFHQRPQRTQSQITRKIRKWDLTPVEVLRIRRQKSICLGKLLCEESNAIEFPHPERVQEFNSWAEFLRK